MKNTTSPAKWFMPMLACLAIGFGFANPASAGFYLRRQEICIEDPAMLREFDNADVNHDGRLDLGEFEILLISL